MKTESIKKSYAAPSVVWERVSSESGFAASDGYYHNGGGQYEATDINDNGEI